MVMTEFGPLVNPCLYVFTEGGAVQFKWQGLFKLLAGGEFSATTIEPYLEQLKPMSGFKVCPGIKEYPQGIPFETKDYLSVLILWSKIHSIIVIYTQ